MTGRATKPIVFGAVIAAVGVLILIMGRPTTEHLDDGYYIDDPVAFDRSTRAIVTSDIDLLEGVYNELADDEFVLYVTSDPTDFRMRGVASDSEALFIGVAPTSAVEQYLEGVAHHEIIAFERDEESKAILNVRFEAHRGTVVPSAPSIETFWALSATGTGLQTLDWTLQPGDWTAVIMNADASPGIITELAFGAAPTANIDAIRTVSLAIGGTALILGGLLLALGLRLGDRDLNAREPEVGEESHPVKEESMIAS